MDLFMIKNKIRNTSELRFANRLTVSDAEATDAHESLNALAWEPVRSCHFLVLNVQ